MSEAVEREELRAIPWRQAVIGCLGLVVAVAAILSADGVVAGLLSVVRSRIDNDYLLVMAFGVVAVALAAVVVATSRDSVRLRRPPEVERPTPAPEPGEHIDARLDGVRPLVPVVGRAEREAVQARLRTAAVRAVAAQRDWPESRASTAIAERTWTDDRVAARFLDGGVPSAFGSGVAALANGETPLRYRARRTVAAIDECGNSRDRRR
jgi:hypothetical protein